MPGNTGGAPGQRGVHVAASPLGCLPRCERSRQARFAGAPSDSALRHPCPARPGEFWIGCDVCELWYHGKCVKVRGLVPAPQPTTPLVSLPDGLASIYVAREGSRLPHTPIPPSVRPHRQTCQMTPAKADGLKQFHAQTASRSARSARSGCANPERPRSPTRFR